MATKETISLRAARDEDRFGDPTGAPPAWRAVPGSIVVPRSSSDYEQRGQIILSGFMVKVPAGTAVADTDEILVRGEIHQLEGVVADYGKKGKLFYTERVN